MHRLDRETSGLLLMGRTEDSISQLHWLFSGVKKGKSMSKVLVFNERSHKLVDYFLQMVYPQYNY